MHGPCRAEAARNFKAWYKHEVRASTFNPWINGEHKLRIQNANRRPQERDDMHFLQTWKSDYLKSFRNCAKKISRIRNGGPK